MKHCIVFVAGLCLGMLFAPLDAYAQTFRYPDIPDSITLRQERIRYMAMHYWDNADLADSTMFFAPKTVLDYIYILTLLSPADCEKSFEKTLALVSPNTRNTKLLMYGLSRYMHRVQSSFYNDELYLQILDIALRSPLDVSLLAELQYERDMASKNRIGQAAEDFSFLCKDGKEKRLYDIDAPLLLLMFNNPDCSRCRNAERYISKNDTVQRMIAENRLVILAVSPESDFEVWQQYSFPNNWMCGYDNRMLVVENRLYEILQYPSLYLLDKDKRVLVKGFDYSAIASMVSQYYGKK